MFLRHLNSFNVTKSYESHSKQTIHLAVWIPGNSKPIAKGSIRKEAHVCELNATHPLLPSLPPSSPYLSFLSLSIAISLSLSLTPPTRSGASHVVSSPPERSMCQGMEASCQKPPANSE